MTTTLVLFDGFPLIGATPAGGTARLTGLDGWIGKTLRRNRLDKAQQDGAWASSGNLAALPITATGLISYPTASAAAAERRALLAIGGHNEASFTVTDALGAGTRTVEVDALSVVPVRDTMLSFTLVVTATDPLLYGPELVRSTSLASTAGGTGRVWPRVWPTDWGIPAGVTAGAVTVPNAGTGTYWPVLRINGPVPNPQVSLVETGDVVRYNAFLSAGQHLDINWGTPRRVTIGDTPASVRNNVASQGNWLAIPPGGGTIVYSADAADPAATLQVWGYEGVYE